MAAENGASTMNKLIGALIEELAHDMPDDPRLETVQADLLAASRCYETGKKKDLALRFYLAVRALMQEIEHLRHAESSKFKEPSGLAAGETSSSSLHH